MPRTAFFEDAFSINECLFFVERFHERVKSPIARLPRTLPCEPASAAKFADRLLGLATELSHVAGTEDILLQRASFALEELAEWLAAHAQGDLVAAADALGDRLYVLLGDAIATGMPLANIFEEVHQSNMTKFPRAGGSDGKGLKGPSYVPPDIAGVLKAYQAVQEDLGPGLEGF